MRFLYGVFNTLIIMFLVMFVTNIVGVTALSWWVVTAPLWGPIVVLTLLVLVIYTLSHRLV